MKGRCPTESVRWSPRRHCCAVVYGFEGIQGDAGVLRPRPPAFESDPASPWYALARAALGFSLYLSGEAGAGVGPLEEAARSEAAFPAIRLQVLFALA